MFGFFNFGQTQNGTTSPNVIVCIGNRRLDDVSAENSRVLLTKITGY